MNRDKIEIDDWTKTKCKIDGNMVSSLMIIFAYLESMWAHSHTHIYIYKKNSRIWNEVLN